MRADMLVAFVPNVPVPPQHRDTESTEFFVEKILWVVSRFVLKMPEPPPYSRRWLSREYLREIDPAVDLPQLNLATRIEPKE